MADLGTLQVRWVRGRTNNTVEFVDNNTVCYPCGNHICFLNLETKAQRVLQGPVRGIGAFTASSSSGTFGFSEKKLYPSIFVYVFPTLQLKSELKGTAKLDYTSLALSGSGPYLACCSSLPDNTITVWNWETAEPMCTQPQAGKDVVSLVFNPTNWLQICALGKETVTVWNMEKSASRHVLKPCVIELPASDGFLAEKAGPTSCIINPSSRGRLTPTATCWTATSELLVGCAEGVLLLIDPDNLSVSILFNPTTPDADPHLSCQGLTLNKNGVIAIGKDGALHCVQIKGTHIDITQTWQIEGATTRATYSPDYETLLLSSDTGQIYTLNPSRSDKVVKVLDVLNGNFVAAAWSHTNKNTCVSLRGSGELQLWSVHGMCLGSLSLGAEVTSVACCPGAEYAAVGTTSGSILFVDLNKEQALRLVHRVKLYHTAVDHLVFDQEGHYLLTGASDSHIYVIDAKASQKFAVIGYTVVPGPVLSLSTQCITKSEHVEVLALCAGQEGNSQSGNFLMLLSLPTTNLTGPECVDRHGCLSPHILKVSKYQVPHSLESCVLGIREMFGYCHKRKSLQRFQPPQDTHGQDVIQLKPELEVKGHPLGPATVALSPHRLWLASVGEDGLLHIRETSSLEPFMELQCHPCRAGGVRSLAFSADHLAILTVAGEDGSLVCTDLGIKGGEAGVENAAQCNQSMAHSLKNTFNTENPVLIDLPTWRQGSCSGTHGTKGREVSDGAEVVDVTEQDETSNSLLSVPPPHPTWLESRRELVMKEEDEKYSDTKDKLRKTIEELRGTIQEMMCVNDALPYSERLQQQDFNLDVEERKRQEALVEEAGTRVRKEIEWEILVKCYLRDVLKRECWDSLTVKGRALKGFYSEHEVKNYPLRERTKEEMEELHRVQNLRKIEMAALGEQKKRTSPEEEEQAQDNHAADSAALTGSFSAQLGFSNPYVYDQFSLQTKEHRINQIVLLQDVIYRIKMGFNTEFEAMYKQKVQEMNRVRNRNEQISEILLELDVKQDLWEPSLSIREQPERLFTVDDSEVKAEKYLTPEQSQEEERKRLEEQRRLAAKVDDYKERALKVMMNGALEVKKEDILKMEIPPPEFVLSKPDVHWTEEEKRAFRQYEKKSKELNERKEKYRKLLETDVKKLQASTNEATKRFDESLKKLFEKKLKCEMAIYQEKLKIIHLVYSVLIEEEMRDQELELKFKLEKKFVHKDELEEEVKMCEEDVEEFHESYDIIVAEDKVLDKDFRKEFYEVPALVVDHLYKLFKRRPRGQKLRAQTDNSPNPFKEQRLCGSLAPDALGKMLKAMEDLDAPENTPEGLNPSVWERFCLVRRTKVESEHKVKAKALTLAEMQAFLQKRRKEYEAAEQEIKDISDDLERLHKEKNHLLMDIMVQVVLKQGHVSLSDLTADNSDCVLLKRSVVEELNKTIRLLGEKKMSSMVERKDFRKGTIQLEWEHKMMRAQIEDLNNKVRDVQMLRLSEEQQDYLNKTDRASRVSKQVLSLEKTIDFQEKSHLRNVQNRKKEIEQLKRQAAMKAEKNKIVEQELPDLQVTVSERRHIHNGLESEESQTATAEERYREIVRRKKLEDTARAQERDLDLLWKELERLRRRNFPSLDQLYHS